MIIKEQNGWKMLKVGSVFYLVCPSGEEVKLNIKSEGNLNNCFNHAVTYNWTWLERTYYTASVVKGEVVVTKDKKNIRSDSVDKFDRSHYVTEAQARQAINDVLPKAEKHFNECLQKYKSLGFSIEYTYSGDTHGIYDDYQYISFKMDNFYFSFVVE